MRYAPVLIDFRITENWNPFETWTDYLIYLFRTDSNTDTNVLESIKKWPQTL